MAETKQIPETRSIAKGKLTLKQITLTGLMTAVICLLAPLSLNIPISPVPISLGYLAVYFVLSVLGMKLGVLSVVAYILLGLAGIPVFTGFTGGPGKLLGPTGGYIVGYIFMALICGYFVVCPSILENEKNMSELFRYTSRAGAAGYVSCDKK